MGESRRYYWSLAGTQTDSGWLPRHILVVKYVELIELILTQCCNEIWELSSCDACVCVREAEGVQFTVYWQKGKICWGLGVDLKYWTWNFYLMYNLVGFTC